MVIGATVEELGFAVAVDVAFAAGALFAVCESTYFAANAIIVITTINAISHARHLSSVDIPFGLKSGNSVRCVGCSDVGSFIYKTSHTSLEQKRSPSGFIA